MLRSLVLILLLVNGAFFAWSQGWLNDLVGVRPDVQREPQRLGLQVHPDKIAVVAPAAAPASSPSEPAPADMGQDAPESTAGPASADTGHEAPAGASSPAASSHGDTQAAAEPEQPSASTTAASRPAKGICLEAGPFTAAEYASAEAMVRPILPAGMWARQAVAVQGMWLVYMGPYADPELLDRKQEELKRLSGVDFEVVRTPAHLAQGISLGGFNKRENADKQLEALRGRGIRTARIVTLRQPSELQLMKVARAEVAAQVRLASLKLPQGKGFTACRS